MDLTVEVQQERPGYWARVLELPGCFASGLTLSELRESVAEAIGLYLWDQPASIGNEPLSVGKARIEVRPPSSPHPR